MVVHARLDQETEKAFELLRKRTGLNDSELLRSAIRLLASVSIETPSKRAAEKERSLGIVGLGAFASEVADLGHNKDHLQGFGE